MPDNRKLPATGLAHDQARWKDLFSSAEKVVLYWPVSAGVVTIVSYYSTVSAANTARDAAAKASGAKPVVLINWAHSDISHIPVGPILHPDAREDLPAWIDEEPNT